MMKNTISLIIVLIVVGLFCLGCETQQEYDLKQEYNFIDACINECTSLGMTYFKADYKDYSPTASALNTCFCLQDGTPFNVGRPKGW